MKHTYVSIIIMGISSLLYATPAQNIHRSLWANYNQFGGNQKAAIAWFKEAIDNDAPLYIQKGYLISLYNSDNPYDLKKIIDFMNTYPQAFKQDADIQLLFARTLDKIGNHEQAEELIINLSNTFKTNAEIVFQAASVYVARKEPKNALKIIDDLLNSSPRKPNNFIFYFLKAQILLSLGQHEAARTNIKLCNEMHPGFDKGWLMRALLEEQLGDLENARNAYSIVFAITGNKEIEQHLTQLLYKQKIEQKRINALMLNKSCIEKALILIEQKQYTLALQQLDSCSEKEPKNSDIYLLKIQTLMTLNETARAAQIIKEQLAKEPEHELWYQTLHLLCRTGLSIQKAIAILEDTVTKNPSLALPYLYLADLHLRLHTPTAALTYLTQAAERTNNPQIKIKILFQMGVLYYEQKDFAAMVTALNKGMRINGEFPPLLNLLAYYYATDGNDLKRAEKLIAQALKKQPLNPHFWDTQAVIYYQQGNYTKAVELLLNAIKEVPLDIMMYKHLGQAYYQLGEVKKARETITQALTMATTDNEKNMCTNLLKSWEQ